MYNSRNIYTPPQKRLGFPWGWGGGRGSVRPKHLKKCIELNWNFQRSFGGRGHKNFPSVREMWIFFVTLKYYYKSLIIYS